MPANEHVVLIPGLAGFGAFGDDCSRKIEYFDHAKSVFRKVRPDMKLHVHEPPPTGSLEARVRSLYQHIVQIVGEEMLRTPSPSGMPVVHLVGHSTGGLDARLLANLAYEDAFDRETLEFRKRVVTGYLGTIVTLSAPLHGSPIAKHLRLVFRTVIDALSLSTIFNSTSRLNSAFAIPKVLFLAAAEGLTHRGGVNVPLLKLLAGMDDRLAGQVQAFRGLMLSDTQLIEDLSPESMAALNPRIKGSDYACMLHFVTVAPPPSFGFDGMLRRLLYAASYWSTADEKFPRPVFPAGRWTEGGADTGLCNAPCANDGVVPSSSQTVDGTAYRLVLGDHLDVIGHFEAWQNTTIFKSGAHFNVERFEALWTDIVRALNPCGAERLEARGPTLQVKTEISEVEA